MKPCSVLITTLDRGQPVRGLQPACLLYITDPEMLAAPSPQEVGEALGLTAAEARVVSALTVGVALPEAAVQLGVSINTARTLLARALTKTGTNSQIALVRMALTSLGPMQRGRD